MLAYGNFKYQWATDASFDGSRLEILSNNGDLLFDVSVSDDGPITVNTFSNEVGANLLMAAIEIANRPR